MSPQEPAADRRHDEAGSGPDPGVGSAPSPIEEPTAIELGPTGAPLGLATAPDFEAEAVAEDDGAPAPGAQTPSTVLAAAPVDRRSARRAPPWNQTRRGAAGAVTAEPHPPLMDDERFRVFWLSRLVTQTAQGALLYALLIVVVDQTDRSFFNSLFVICSIVPSLAFGLPAGMVADALPRRPLLVGLNLIRFFFLVFLVVREPSLLGIFATTLAIWTIHQFYSPVESAALATLVAPARYTAAQALSNLALTLAQLMGLVILAPVLLKTAGPRPLFALCAALFVVAAGFTMLLPRMDDHLVPGTSSARQVARRRAGSMRAALMGGWRVVRADRTTYEALADDVLVGIGMSSLVVIMPLYLRRVLDTAAENTVFVFAPAALGLVLGLRYAPRIGRVVGERRTATMALIGFAVCVGSLGFVKQLHGFLTDGMQLPLNQVAELASIPRLVLIAMLLSIPAGFASALVSVTARSVLLARTPSSARGQVIATQSLLGNLGALVPTLLAGIAADLVGVEPIAVAIAVAIAAGALAAHTVGRRPRAAPVVLREA